MSATMTLAALRLAAQQRADMVNSDFVEETEWNSFIQQSAFELYDLLVQKYGDDYYIEEHSFSGDGVNQLFALPDDFYKFRGLDIQLTASAESRVSVLPFNLGERNRYSPGVRQAYGATDIRYRLRANKIWLNQIPALGQAFVLLYVPRLVEFVDDDSELDGVSGWTEYVIVDAAIKALDKEESDTTKLEQRKAQLTARIEAAAANRDAGAPATVTDIYADGGYPFGDDLSGGY